MPWNLSDVEVGDEIKVEVVNKHGDRNLDGCSIFGRVVEKIPSHRMVRLHTGWHVHTKDRLIYVHPTDTKENSNAQPD